MTYQFLQRLNSDGTLDTSFNDIDNNIISGYINSIQEKSNGNILIAGSQKFLSNPDYTIDNIAKLNSDGTLNSQQYYNYPYSIITSFLQNEGEFIWNYVQIGGNSYSPAYGLIKYDNSFNQQPLTTVYFNSTNGVTFNFDPLGKLYVTDPYGSIFSNISNGFILLNFNGNYNTTLNGSFNYGALFTNSNGLMFATDGHGNLIKLNSDGTQDYTFLPAISNFTICNILDDGSLIFASNSSNTISINLDQFSFIVKLNSNYSYDTNFTNNALAAINNIGLYGINQIIPYNDGKFLIFAVRTSDDASILFRLNSDGTQDNTFNIFTYQSPVYFTILENGQFYATTNVYNGSSINGLIRLNSDGTQDNTFTLAQSVNIDSPIIIQSSGQIIYNTGYIIGRLNTDGSVDNTFTNYSVTASINNFLVLPNDQILISGTSNDNAYQGLIRLNSDGTQDNTFINFGISANPDLVFLGNNILCYGAFSTFFPLSSSALIRLNADGSYDNTFVLNNLSHNINNVILTPDSQIFLSGLIQTSASPATYAGVIKLNSDGSYNSTVVSSAPTNYCNIYDATRLLYVTNDNPAKFYRIYFDGTIDSTFNGSLNTIGLYNGNNVNFSIDTNGNIIIYNGFFSWDQVSYTYITRALPNGDIDNSFNANNSNSIANVRLFSDNTMLVTTNNIANYPSGLIKLNNDGSYDNTYIQLSPPSSGSFSHALITNSNDIIATGSFHFLNGDIDVFFSELDVNGNRVGTLPQDTFNTIFNQNNYYIINMTSSQSDEIYIIISNTALYRLNPDYTIDQSFTLNGQFFTTFLLMEDGILLASTASTFYKTDFSGNINPDFQQITYTGQINCIDIDQNNAIWIAGNFGGITDSNNVTWDYPYIAKLNPNGSVDSTFSSPSPNNSITAMQILNNKVIVAGQFTNMQNQNSPSNSYTNLMRLNLDGTIDNSFIPYTHPVYVVAFNE